MCHTLCNYSNFKNSDGNGRPFQPPPPRGEQVALEQPRQQEGGGGNAFPHIDREVNAIFEGHGSQENKREQKLIDQ